MMIVIRNGRVIDPATGEDKVRDLGIYKSKIISLDEAPNTAVFKTIDATGMIVMPGFIDLRAFLGEPGFEDRETFKTALAAAAKGGFTTVVASPDTDPACDNAAVCEFIKEKTKGLNAPMVLPSGAVSVGLKGEKLAPLGELAQAGCRLVGDMDFALKDGSLVRRAMEYGSHFGLRYVTYPLDKELWGKGVIREGFMSTKLGLPGTPPVAESAPLVRDLMLAAYTNTPIHVARINSREALEWMRAMKTRYANLDVTCDVTTFHLFFCDEDLADYSTSLKFLPPLGSKEGMKALRRALRDGIIDVVVSAHRPRNLIDKMVELDEALPGTVGFETTASALFTLAAQEQLTYPRIAEALSRNPARILGLTDRGTLKAGSVADVTIIDPNRKHKINSSELLSMSKVTPFDGRELTGKVVATIAEGREIYNELQNKA